MIQEKTSLRRKIRSFVLREGRMTAGQEKAYSQYWPALGLLVADGMLDPLASFGRAAPLILEIGFGMGQSLAEMAAADRAANFLGVEVHRPGVGKLLALAGELQLDNLSVYRHDAVEVLEQCIAPASLSRVQLYFPDPWHKTKHHKRRLVQTEFVSLVASRLAPGGVFHLATDWQHYAEHMLEVMEASPEYTNQLGPGSYAPRPAWRPETKFERRGARLGHGVWDLLYSRQD